MSFIHYQNSTTYFHRACIQSGIVRKKLGIIVIYLNVGRVEAVENSDTLTTPNFQPYGIESNVSQNVTQTLSTLISLAMALILTPSLSQTHFCKSDNCRISKVTRDSALICQILTLT
jgi:hypothetical protein